MNSKNCPQDQSVHFTTANHHVLKRGRYSAQALYFINKPKRNGAQYTWIISENLRDLGRLAGKQIDPEGLRDYLCYGFVPAPRTIFKDVLTLPPGHFCYLPLASEQAEWGITDSTTQANSDHSESNFWQQICTQSQHKQAAVLLSGGLDSAMISAAAQQTGTTLTAYHARFCGLKIAEDSDTLAARTTAHSLGIPLQEIAINSLDALRYFSRAVNALPQPFSDPVILPFYLLLNTIQKTSTQLVLTGEGGDQLFGSWSMKPMLIRELYHETEYSRDLGYLASFHKFDTEWQDLMSEKILRQLPRQSKAESPIATAFAASPSNHFCDQLRWVDLQLKGLQHIQPRIAAMAQAHQLQLQHPFFHPEVIESALNLPAQLKLSGTEEKVLLKKLATAHLPANIVERRKQGMGVPTSLWFRRGLRPLAAYWLNRNRLKNSGVLNPDYVREMVYKTRTASDGRGRRWGDRLWQLCALECWLAGLNSD